MSLYVCLSMHVCVCLSMRVSVCVGMSLYVGTCACGHVCVD